MNWDDQRRAYEAQNRERNEIARRQNEEMMRAMRERQQQQQTPPQHHSNIGTLILLGVLVASTRVRHAFLLLSIAVLGIGLIFAFLSPDNNNGGLGIAAIGGFGLLLGAVAEMASRIIHWLANDLRSEWFEEKE